ncbi:MAG: NUDIX domain-containing protein [Erysipelotrichaceae bacterium]|nr:NUDIX domain-containing protein [Erysipelotrichaceae bacterium]
MIEVKFYDAVEDHLLKYAVIVARYQDQWVFVRHKCRDSWECPGGKRNVGESIEACARRELWEESGANLYDLFPVSVYSVTKENIETFGMLYYADIHEFDDLPKSEITEVELLNELPTHWTYPNIQPYLFSMISSFLLSK